MNLKTIISSKMITGGGDGNLIYKNKVTHEYPNFEVFQHITTNCTNCNYKLSVHIPSGMVNQVDLIESLGKRINELRVENLELALEIKSLGERI